MKITETKLRSLIRQVILESNMSYLEFGQNLIEGEPIDRINPGYGLYLVTGEESKTAVFGKNLKQLSYESVEENTSNEKEETSGVWRDEENHDDEEEQEDEYVDPLVKALRDSISDDETNDY